MKLLRRFLAPLLAFLVALAPAQPQLSLPIAPATVLAVSAVTAAINFTPLSAGALTPAEKPVILGGIQSWSFPGSSADLYFARNAGSCAINRLLKPCASLLTTTRASTGYAQWADGHLSLFAANVPRITDLGLLVEQAATNLALQSQALATSPWSVVRTVATNNSTASPDGTTTGTLIQATSTSSGAWVRIPSLTVTAQTYTLSGYLKAGTASTVRLNIFDGADRFADFTLTGSGSTSNVGSGVTAVISQASNGWYRCSISLTTSATASGEIQFRFPGSTLTGTETFYVWGAQLETGTFPTSYIPTTTVAVTRAADSILLAGAALIAANNAVAIRAVTNQVASYTGRVLIRLVSYGGGAEARINVSDQAELFSNGTTLDATLGSGAYTGLVTAVYDLDASGLKVIANGGTPVTSATSGAGTNSGSVQIGNNSGLARALNGYVSRLSFAPARIFDRITAP